MSTPATRIPVAALTAFSRYGGQALKPTYNPHSGRWRKALVSPRLAAKVRKEAIRTSNVGEGKMWNPAWDFTDPKLPSLKAPKSTKRDRTREKRALKIEAAMETMDKRIAEYKATVVGRKPTPGIETLFKRLNRAK